MATAKRKATKPAVEEIDEDLELEVDETEEETPAPKKARTKKTKAEKPKAEPIEFGSGWLAEHVNQEAGTSHTPYSLRILLRKLTAEGTLQRGETQGRARYAFTGPEDPQVVAIVEAVKNGVDKKAEQERLQGLKDKRAAKKASAPKSKKAKADVEPEPEEDDFDDEIEDI